MDKNQNSENDIATLIKNYLKRHPDSEDTISGITQWWLKEQQINDSIIAVDCALKALELEGEVCSTIRNNQVYFRLSKMN